MVCCTEIIVVCREVVWIKYRPRVCKSVHSWVADSIVIPLNILIRMNLSIKKRWQSIWENRYFKIKPLAFYVDLVPWFITTEWSKRIWIVSSCFCVSAFRPIVFKLQHASESPGWFLKTLTSRPQSAVLKLAFLSFPNDAPAGGQQTTF